MLLANSIMFKKRERQKEINICSWKIRWLNKKDAFGTQFSSWQHASGRKKNSWWPGALTDDCNNNSNILITQYKEKERKTGIKCENKVLCGWITFENIQQMLIRETQPDIMKWAYNLELTSIFYFMLQAHKNFSNEVSVGKWTYEVFGISFFPFMSIIRTICWNP